MRLSFLPHSGQGPLPGIGGTLRGVPASRAVAHSNDGDVCSLAGSESNSTGDACSAFTRTLTSFSNFIASLTFAGVSALTSEFARRRFIVSVFLLPAGGHFARSCFTDPAIMANTMSTATAPRAEKALPNVGLNQARAARATDGPTSHASQKWGDIRKRLCGPWRSLILDPSNPQQTTHLRKPRYRWAEDLGWGVGGWGGGRKPLGPWDRLYHTGGLRVGGWRDKVGSLRCCVSDRGWRGQGRRILAELV